MLTTDLETANGKVAMLTTDLETEQGKVAMLTTDLETEQGKVAMLTTDLETEQGKVAQLTTDLETANGRITELEGQLNTANAQLGVFNTADSVNSAVATLMTLAGEDDAEGSAPDDGQEVLRMLDVVSVKGNSVMAEANAQKVLAARTMLDNAITAATTAKMAAETAKAALPEDAAPALVKVLDDAIAAADKQIEAAQKVLDAKASTAGSLASYVEMVTGDDEDDLKDAADIAKGVADRIHTALTTAANIPDAVAIPAGHTAGDTIGKLVMGPSDAQGMTWAEIGGSSLMDMRISTGAVSPATTRAVMAKSVAGMTADKLGQTAAPGTADGTEVASATYKGITGTLFCAGSDCKVEHVDTTAGFIAATSKLTGSWYFAPDGGSMTTYLAGTGAAAGTYSVEVSTNATMGYAQYGYWLSVASATDDTTTVNRYLTGPAAQTAAVYGIDAAVKAFEGTSASYEGDAVGMSVAWTTDTRGKEVTGSRKSATSTPTSA